MFSQNKQFTVKYFTEGNFISKFGATAVNAEDVRVVFGGSVARGASGFDAALVVAYSAADNLNIQASGVA